MSTGANRFSALKGGLSQGNIRYVGQKNTLPISGKFEVHRFDLSVPSEKDDYQKLMDTVYNNPSQYYDLRRETFEFDVHDFIRVEFFKVGSPQNKPQVKMDLTYGQLMKNIMKEIEEIEKDQKNEDVVEQEAQKRATARKTKKEKEAEAREKEEEAKEAEEAKEETKEEIKEETENKDES